MEISLNGHRNTTPGVCPQVKFSKQERDGLADEQAHLYLHGTDDQAHLALVAIRGGLGEGDPYIPSEPYARSYDLLLEIFETLTSSYSEVYWCTDCLSPVSRRARRVLIEIKDSGGQKGQEYYANLETRWKQQVAAQEREWRSQQ